MKNIGLALVLILLSSHPATLNAKPLERQRAIDAVQLDAIRGLYETSHSDRYRERLIFAYEGYLIQYCREELSQPVPKQTPAVVQEPSSCSLMLEKLGELLPNIPLVICFKKGFRSQECLTAYSQIDIKPASEFLNLDPGTRFGPNLGEKEMSEVSELQQKISQISEDASIEVVAKRNLLIENYLQILKIACTAAQNKYTPDFSKRTRYIPTLCYETTQTLLGLDRSNSQAICYREGFIAPRCQFAASVKQASQSGLEKF